MTNTDDTTQFDPSHAIFFSYRREDKYLARTLVDTLNRHNFNVFIDFEKLDSGSFSQSIEYEIRRRDHFLLLITRSLLRELPFKDDFVRREIKTALQARRNIVPVLANNVEWEDTDAYLVDELQVVKGYHGLVIPRRETTRWFNTWAKDVIDRTIEISRERLKHPPSIEKWFPLSDVAPGWSSEESRSDDQIRTEATRKQYLADARPLPTENQMKAEELYDEAIGIKDMSHRLILLNQALDAYPAYEDALLERGRILSQKRDYLAARQDLEAILEFHPTSTRALFHLALIYETEGKNNQATTSYKAVITQQKSLWVEAALRLAQMQKSRLDDIDDIDKDTRQLLQWLVKQMNDVPPDHPKATLIRNWRSHLKEILR